MPFARFFSVAYLKKITPQLLYVIFIPFYMLLMTYMLSQSSFKTLGGDQWLISPLLWGTIWIPAFLGLFINQFLKKRREADSKHKWEKNFPIVFISMYSVFFFVMSSFSFGKHYLTAAFSSLILVIFLLLLKNAQKEMFYLPPPKEFWFYFLTFVPPISMLFFTDVYFLVMQKSPYFILLSPVSYLPEILGFWVYCFLRKHFRSKKKRGKLTLFQAIFIMQIFNVATSFYIGSSWGDKVIWIALTFSFAALLFADRFSKYRPDSFVK